MVVMRSPSKLGLWLPVKEGAGEKKRNGMHEDLNSSDPLSGKQRDELASEVRGSRGVEKGREREGKGREGVAIIWSYELVDLQAYRLKEI